VNEKIKVLAEQAHEYATANANGTSLDVLVIFKEKFAELLLHDTIKVLVTGSGNEKTSDAIWDLEEHFGINVSDALGKIADKDYVT